MSPAQNQSLRRIEEKLDLILKQADLAYIASRDIAEDSVEALRSGTEKEVAKLY